MNNRIHSNWIEKVYIPRGILSNVDIIVLVRGACLPPEALVSSPTSFFHLFFMRGESYEPESYDLL